MEDAAAIALWTLDHVVTAAIGGVVTLAVVIGYAFLSWGRANKWSA